MLTRDRVDDAIIIDVDARRRDDADASMMQEFGHILDFILMAQQRRPLPNWPPPPRLLLCSAKQWIEVLTRCSFSSDAGRARLSRLMPIRLYRKTPAMPSFMPHAC